MSAESEEVIFSCDFYQRGLPDVKNQAECDFEIMNGSYGEWAH
jgi:hypothetical protein